VNAPQATDLGPTLALRMLVFGLVLVYHLMAPLIIPCGIAYLTFSYVTERYNLLFVYKSLWESGGSLWQSAFHNFMLLILLFQCVMIGLLAVNKFIAVAAIAPLPIITCIAWYSMFKLYCHMGQWGSLQDGFEGEEDSIDLDSFVNAYIQPPFIPLPSNDNGDQEEGGDSAPLSSF
jgi:hypothetical protein